MRSILPYTEIHTEHDQGNQSKWLPTTNGENGLESNPTYEGIPVCRGRTLPWSSTCSSLPEGSSRGCRRSDSLCAILKTNDCLCQLCIHLLAEWQTLSDLPFAASSRLVSRRNCELEREKRCEPDLDHERESYLSATKVTCKPSEEISISGLRQFAIFDCFGQLGVKTLTFTARSFLFCLSIPVSEQPVACPLASRRPS